MQIIVCKLVHLLLATGDSATKPKPGAVAGTAKMLRHAGRIMKLTAILILGACLQIHATGLGQGITLTVKDASLESVFKQVQKQTDYRFLYTSQLLEGASRVSFSLKNASVKELLDECFKGQRLDYEVSEKMIVVRPKVESNKIVYNEPSQINKNPIKIIIVDENGAPAQGVNVTVKGTNRGATTNLKGECVFDELEDNAVIIITSVGYDRQEIPVLKKILITTQLRVAVGNLDEMQVIAYGTTSKRFSTGNISTIKAADIENQPVQNPLLALQGRVPGVLITQATGLPGTGITVQIQGQNSISNGNDPLYVIDGVPFSSQLFGSFSGVLGRSGSNNGESGNPLSFINPADIESIDVLKDADATAIYGSRAANGAILITTKKGKAGKTTIDFNIKHGFGEVPHFINLLNLTQYLEMRHEALINDGISPSSNDYDINGTWDTTRAIDWQKELIGGKAKYSDAHLSISGGGGRTTFLLAGGYHKETSVFPGSFADKKMSFQFNLSNVSSNDKFRIQVSGSYLFDENNLSAIDLTNMSITLPPNAPDLFSANGNLNWAQLPNGISTWTNPLAFLKRKYSYLAHNLISNVSLSYQILPGLTVKSSMGYNEIVRDEITTIPLSYFAPDRQQASTRSSSFYYGNLRSWIVEPQLMYTRNIGNGVFEALLGSTLMQSERDKISMLASGFSSDLVMEDIHSAPTVTPFGNSEAAVYKYNAVFGRVNYNFGKKYIINVNVRRDGSSRFGSKNLFHNFGSIGAAWLFSEQLFTEKKNWLSFGKLRASYGTTGSDQIGDYGFMNLYTFNSTTVPYGGVSGLSTNDLPNPYLQWEKTKKVQIGLDLGFWHDKFLLNANLFYNRSTNQLQSYALPYFTAPSGGIIINFPATLQNSGLEFSLSSFAIQNQFFKWKSSFNITIPKNKLVKYDNLSSSSFANTYIIGQPITISKGFNYLGVDPQTGLFIFVDNLGNSTSYPISSDRTFLINTLPKFYGGFQNSFSYKGFELDFLFQFVKQLGRNYIGDRPGRFSSSNTGGITVGNQPMSVMNRWQKVGDLSETQVFSALYPTTVRTPYTNYNVSNAVISDASFIRLKNLSLSCQFPQVVKSKKYFQSARLFLQGQNLITITKYKGLDPETQNISSLPPLRVWAIGIQLRF